ncbi:unnamed protein product [Mytilus edulis]|uniref:Uncharacterized protein n=1 Tax=Mytilus edulis TaxID=6550 RepID=A0A8S3T698_MYTED|nr:unnamed protein product [Mytilus edulis]
MQVYRQTIGDKETMQVYRQTTIEKRTMHGYRQTIRKIINNAEDFDNEFVNISKAATFVRKDIFEINSEFKGTFPKECQEASVPQSMLSLSQYDSVYRQTIRKFIDNNSDVQTNHKEDKKQCSCTDKPQEDKKQCSQTIREIRNNAGVETNYKEMRNNADVQTNIREIRKNAGVQTNHKEIRNNADVQTNHKEDKKQCMCSDKP